MPESIPGAVSRLSLAGTFCALLATVGPVATIFFGYWFLSEPVTVIQITGAALVLSGVTLVTIRST